MKKKYMKKEIMEIVSETSAEITANIVPKELKEKIIKKDGAEALEKYTMHETLSSMLFVTRFLEKLNEKLED